MKPGKIPGYIILAVWTVEEYGCNNGSFASEQLSLDIIFFTNTDQRPKTSTCIDIIMITNSEE